MRFFTNLVPLRLELSESASLGDSYHVRRVRLNLMTLKAELLRSAQEFPRIGLRVELPCVKIRLAPYFSWTFVSGKTWRCEYVDLLCRGVVIWNGGASEMEEKMGYQE